MVRAVGRPKKYNDGLSKEQRYRQRRKSGKQVGRSVIYRDGLSANARQAAGKGNAKLPTAGHTGVPCASEAKRRRLFGVLPPEKLADICLAREDYNSLVSLFRAFHNLVAKMGSKPCLVCGGLIGYFREGQLLPWDDDVDTIIRENDVAEFAALPWSDAGLKLIRGPSHMYWVCWKDGGRRIPVQRGGHYKGHDSSKRWPFIGIAFSGCT